MTSFCSSSQMSFSNREKLARLSRPLRSPGCLSKAAPYINPVAASVPRARSVRALSHSTVLYSPRKGSSESPNTRSGPPSLLQEEASDLRVAAAARTEKCLGQSRSSSIPRRGHLCSVTVYNSSFEDLKGSMNFFLFFCLLQVRSVVLISVTGSNCNSESSVWFPSLARYCVVCTVKYWDRGVCPHPTFSADTLIIPC